MTYTWPFPIYLSGPMFSPGDLAEQRTIAAMLELAHDPADGPVLADLPTSPDYAAAKCYLPQRDGIEVGNVMGMLNDPIISSTIAAPAMKAVRKVVFALDMFQLLKRCGAVVFNMDGRVPDDGSVVESAAAYTSGRVVVIFKDTPVSMLGGADNPMVSGLSRTWEYVTDFGHIAGALMARLGDVTEPPAFTPSPELARVIDDGELVWENMATIHWVQKKLPGLTKDLQRLEKEAIEEIEHELAALVRWVRDHLH